MSLSVTYTRADFGINAPLVTVEVHLSNGLPGLSIVGLPETAVKESKDRVRSAIINSQFEFPARRITINLAPADLPKNGGRYDLAIAIGILMASGQLSEDNANDYEFIGELALSGKLRCVSGILPASVACGEANRSLLVSTDNATEAALSTSTPVFGAESLLQVCAHLMSEDFQQISRAASTPPQALENSLDIRDVRGQRHPKRALEIAAAGGHNLLMYGPPGTGKTMLASRLPGILPPLTQAQSLEVASIHSLCGKSRSHWHLPPFRNPHHTASAVALVGGGSHPRPGEISLAHRGVLFLDELPEFQRQVLEVMRQPLESGEILISRASAQLCFPARFQLVAAMNPCACGYLNAHPTRRRRCQCTSQQVQRYRQKISGPLLDRIDLHVPVNDLSMEDLEATSPEENDGESSAIVRARIVQAREQQYHRQGGCNAHISEREIKIHCELDVSTQKLLVQAIDRLGLSARAYHRIIKVARTIADLNQQENITQEQIAEALSFRNFDRGPG